MKEENSSALLQAGQFAYTGLCRIMGMEEMIVASGSQTGWSSHDEWFGNRNELMLDLEEHDKSFFFHSNIWHTFVCFVAIGHYHYASFLTVSFCNII